MFDYCVIGSKLEVVKEFKKFNGEFPNAVYPLESTGRYHSHLLYWGIKHLQLTNSSKSIKAKTLVNVNTKNLSTSPNLQNIYFNNNLD